MLQLWDSRFRHEAFRLFHDTLGQRHSRPAAPDMTGRGADSCERPVAAPSRTASPGDFELGRV